MNTKEIGQEISKELRTLNIDHSIKKAPVSTLRECLNFYTKDKLFDLAKEHEDYISKANKKAEMIELFEEILFKNIEKDSQYITNEEKDIIAKIIKGERISGLEMEKTRSFKDLGYIYWFYHKGEIQIVCPSEIGNRYMATYEDNEEIVKINNKILDYANALQHIYGIYEVEQFLVVWNRYNKEKLDKEYLDEFMNRLGKGQSYFWLNGPYIVSDYFFDVEDYERFLESSVGKEYYMPTEKEIGYYMKEEFDINNIYYKNILRYFEKQDSLNLVQLDDLMLSIEVSCTLNKPFQEIINEINDLGFKFKNVNELNVFIKDYINLSNNTRKWELKGYKPVELSDEKPVNNVVQLKDNKNRKRKKIGRNQPCPCGSGKKYKFCCID